MSIRVVVAALLLAACVHAPPARRGPAIPLSRPSQSSPARVSNAPPADAARVAAAPSANAAAIAPISLDDGGADLVLLHGRIVTLDPNLPEATALAVRADRIAAVGSDAEIQRLAGARTRRIHLRGKLVLPGFIDSHAHFLGVGDQLLQLDLREARTWDEIVALVARAASSAPPGQWIRGRGWHQEKWDAPPVPALDGVPLHGSLSAVTPHHPVVLVHASGHAAFVNAKALELAGIDATTPDPPGGTIVRGSHGKATGMLLERAEDLVDAARARATADPRQARSDFQKRVALATKACLENGITTLHDAGETLETIDRLHELAEKRALGVRLYVMARDDHEALRTGLATRRWIGVGEGFLTVRAIKEQIDGALGSHGAWLLAPYEDLPASSGLNTTGVAQIRTAAEIARENGFQLAVHAIGDRANRETLDVYQSVLGPNAAMLDHRWRVEHAQHLDPADVQRFRRLGVIASMQSIHCISDGPWVPKRLGEARAARGAYVWRSLLDSGATLCNGTDAPVEDLDPIACFYAAVTRRMADGREFQPAQRMTREEALRSYTLSGAYAAFEEDVKGSLVAGKYADLVVLDRDILRCPDDEILGASVVYTIVAGKVAFERR
jgi:predicted amidohydrolase YtcJ